MNQDLSGSWCIKETNESTLVTDSLVPLMHRDVYCKTNIPEIVSKFVLCSWFHGKDCKAPKHDWPLSCEELNSITPEGKVHQFSRLSSSTRRYFELICTKKSEEQYDSILFPESSCFDYC